VGYQNLHPVRQVRVCMPHAVLRIKVYDSKELAGAPATFKSSDPKDKDWAGLKYTIQVAPEDCTGCGICVDICPRKQERDAPEGHQHGGATAAARA